MTRLSQRFLWPLSVCFLVALVPVVVHSYFRLEVEDCNSISALLTQAVTPSPIAGRDVEIRGRFLTSQWREGTFESDDLRFTFSVIRSYDAKRLYHRPEDVLVEHMTVASQGLELLKTDWGSLPIHRAYYANTDPAIVVSYLLVYHSSPVASPYRAQLRAAPAT